MCVLLVTVLCVCCLVKLQNEDDDEIYSLHETAYNAYSKLDKFLDDSREVILFASTQSKKEHRLTIVSCVVTVISIILALVALF